MGTFENRVSGDSEPAILAVSEKYTGIWGESNGGASGVYGRSPSWHGVFGESDTNTGVLGQSKTLYGVTAAEPGQAMRVTDRLQAIGAIIGKALTPLREGQGPVLVLVGLS